MEDVVWYRKPLLSEPVAILAFEGWSDAGNTATGCVENLSSTYDVEPFAELNSDSYYNYQMRRPVVEVKEFGERNFHWPQTSFYSIEDYKLKSDLILVFGEEPSMKWKDYSRNISDTLLELGVKKAVTLGAFFGQVAHTLPVPIFGVSGDPTFHSRHNVLNPNYSGPTGITSIVGQNLRDIISVNFREVFENLINGNDKLINHKHAGKGEVELEGIRKNGELIPIMMRLSKISLLGENYVYVTINDLTELKQKEQQVDSISRFPEENPHFVLRVDQKGEISYANYSSKSFFKEVPYASKRVVLNYLKGKVDLLFRDWKPFYEELKIENDVLYYNNVEEEPNEEGC